MANRTILFNKINRQILIKEPTRYAAQNKTRNITIPRGIV